MSSHIGGRRLLVVLGLTRRHQELVIAGCFVGFLLLLGVCGCQKKTAANAPAAPSPTADNGRHEVSGIVTFADPIKRQMAVKHNGAPGVLTAGENLFAVAPQVEIPKPSEAIGQNVDFVIEPMNNQWVVIEVRRKR